MREKRMVSRMSKSSSECDDCICRLAHKLIVKLTVIVGNSELLSAKAEAGSEYAQRVGLIRDVAKEMAKELQQQQCHPLEAASRCIQKADWI